jgi:ubiquinone/menaquinone biosynthesis C-methylase UbiE
MSRRTAPEIQIWDTDYRLRGKLWGGMTSRLTIPSPGSRSLELGCGSGKTAGLLAGAGSEIVAVDFSRAAVAMNSTRARENAGFDLVVADARALPFRPETFDFVFAIHVLGHMGLAGRRHAAGEAIRVLAEGGTLVFRSFSQNDFRSGIGEETEPGTFLRGTGVITHYFCEEEVLDLFSSLMLVRIQTFPWTMRVRGSDLVREEITAEFTKR